MPATCAITGKTYKMVTKRSHSKVGTKTKVKPNLQRVRIGNKMVKISTRALKKLKQVQ